MSERRVQIKLVAIADVRLRAGEDIDAVITVPEHGISTTQITSNLVMMMTCPRDPNRPTGLAAYLGEMVERGLKTDR